MPPLKTCENERKRHGFGTMSSTIFYLILLAGLVSADNHIGRETAGDNSVKIEKLQDLQQAIEAAGPKPQVQEVKQDEANKPVEPPKVEASIEKGSKSNGEDNKEEKKIDSKTSEAKKADKSDESRVDDVKDTDVKDTKLTNRTEAHVPGPEMESGAMRRGVLVFVALGVLFIMYVGFKTYCGKKSANQSVRKYGVRGRRSDIEMTPLPLDEEDDETVFDVGNLNR